MEKRYLTVQETAELLGVATITIRREISKGKIPAIRVGKAIRVDGRRLEHSTRPARTA